MEDWVPNEDDWIPDDEYEDVECAQILAVTTLAVMIESDVWIPRSVIAGGDTLEVGDPGPLKVQRWFVDLPKLRSSGLLVLALRTHGRPSRCSSCSTSSLQQALRKVNR
jgi:hypothetical protein